MFYYYGRKKQIAKYYPKPKYGSIIEPFAGSAAYSLHDNHWENDVLLIEKNLKIVSLWHYLQQAKKKDIEGLPDVDYGDSLDKFNLSDDEVLLLSVHVIPGATSKRNKVGKFSRWASGKKYISENLHKIKHWRIIHADYKSFMFHEEKPRTWFIDPPYLTSGKHYSTTNQVDYSEMSKSVLQLNGLIICCEGEGANYLPFEPLTFVNNGGMNKSKKRKELIYTFDREG